MLPNCYNSKIKVMVQGTKYRNCRFLTNLRISLNFTFSGSNEQVRRTDSEALKIRMGYNKRCRWGGRPLCYIIHD
jgi:hypothetical protein